MFYNEAFDSLYAVSALSSGSKSGITKRLNIIVYTLLFFFLFVPSSFAAENPYVKLFQAMRAENAADISSLLKQGMEQMDYSMVIAALNRITELRLTNLRLDVKDVFYSANSAMDPSKARTAADMRDVFLASIYALGAAGDTNDAQTLSAYAPRFSDTEILYAFFTVLGGFTNEPMALTTMHDMAPKITSERLAERLVMSILQHNKRESIVTLMLLQQKAVFSPRFKVKTAEAIRKLEKEGR